MWLIFCWLVLHFIVSSFNIFYFISTHPLKDTKERKYKYASFYCALLYCSRFYRLNICGNLVSSKSISIIFPNAFAAHFVSYFGNSHKISEFFIIITFVIVICDQWSLVLLLQKDYDSLKVLIMVSIFKQ